MTRKFEATENTKAKAKLSGLVTHLAGMIRVGEGRQGSRSAFLRITFSYNMCVCIKLTLKISMYFPSTHQLRRKNSSKISCMPKILRVKLAWD